MILDHQPLPRSGNLGIVSVLAYTENLVVIDKHFWESVGIRKMKQAVIEYMRIDRVQSSEK